MKAHPAHPYPRAGSTLHKSFQTEFCSSHSWGPQRWRTAACLSERPQRRHPLPPRSFPPPTADAPSCTLSPLPLALPLVKEEVWFISPFAAQGGLFAASPSPPAPAGASFPTGQPCSCLLDTLQQTQIPSRNTISGAIQRVDQTLDLLLTCFLFAKVG